MSLSRYAGQMNVQGHVLTEREARTLKPHPTDSGAMQYKLKGKLTRKFIPLVASVKVAGLTIKKVRKTRSNKGTTRGPRAKLSPIGLAGMKIMMRRGRAPKVTRHLVTPGSLMGLAGMKIMPGRKTRKNKGVSRKVSESPIGLAGMKIMLPRGRPRKVVRHLVTPGSLMGLAGMKIMPGRKTRKNKGVKRGSRVRKVRSVPIGGTRKVRVTRRKTRSL